MTLPGPNRVSVHAAVNTNLPNSGMQDPGFHGNMQDPGPPPHPHHHPHVSARPMVYLQAPPPPIFPHYQWPMPFSYNPFTGFPGMGYGMVMPPFPPPPHYMEPPAYLLPHPHAPAVDYRRLLHPQVHAHGASFQTANPSRRVRPPPPAHTAPVRQTVNSEVQTEPTHRSGGYGGGGSMSRGSDSGHITSSNSPSSNSGSEKRGSADSENYPMAGNQEDYQINETRRTVKLSSDFPHPKGINVVHTQKRASPEMRQNHKKANVGGEKVPSCVNVHCNMWSVSSQESMVPVCSSSQQENLVDKERRVSIPDILMSWGTGTPQSKSMTPEEQLTQYKRLPLVSNTDLEHEKPLFESPAETHHDPVEAETSVDDLLTSQDREALYKIVKLPSALYDVLCDSREEKIVGRQCLFHSLNTSSQLLDDETNLPEDTIEVTPYGKSFSRRNMNESIWSVESLAPFIPSTDWFLQNNMMASEVIVEVTEEPETCRNSTQNDHPTTKQTHRFSPSDSVPVSGSYGVFSTPAERSPSKKPGDQREDHASDTRGQNQTPPQESSAPHTLIQTKPKICPPTSEGPNEKRSSEPEAHRSPNQESLVLKKQQEKTSAAPEEDVQSSATEESSSSDNLNQVDHDEEEQGRKNVCPPAEQKTIEVSLRTPCPQCHRKERLVDCGIQCEDIECFCEKKSRKALFHPSDVKKGKEGLDVTLQKNQRRSYQRRSRGASGIGRNPRF